MSVTARQVAVRALVPGVPGRLGLQQRRRLLLLLLLLATSGDGHRSARSADRPDICITTRHQSVTSHAFTAVESERSQPARRAGTWRRSAQPGTVPCAPRGAGRCAGRIPPAPGRFRCPSAWTAHRRRRRVASRLVSSHLVSPLAPCPAPPHHASRPTRHTSHVTHQLMLGLSRGRSVSRSVGRSAAGAPRSAPRASALLRGPRVPSRTSAKHGACCHLHASGLMLPARRANSSRPLSPGNVTATRSA